ncbi:hypothetical protein [Xylanimonas cellulosilytica]|nr:hypothetical protein [Xylanimonas cellulosilytica]
MPTAPPATPYGVAPPTLTIGDALSFAWAKFRQNWASWVAFALIFVAATVLLVLPATLQAVDAADRAVDRGEVFTMDDFRFTAAATGLMVLGGLLSYVAQAMAWHAALREADGARPSLAQFVAARRLGVAVLTGIVIAVASGIVAFIPFGSIAWQIFTVFAIAFVVDRSLSPFAAIAESFRTVGRNFGSVFVLLLTLLGINLLGFLALGVGLLVTLPLSVLALTYAFRRITGGTIV